jgi:hypothetical protein
LFSKLIIFSSFIYIVLYIFFLSSLLINLFGTFIFLIFLSIRRLIFGEYRVFTTCSFFNISNIFSSISFISSGVFISDLKSSKSISKLVFLILLKLYQFFTWLEWKYGKILKSKYHKFTHVSNISYLSFSAKVFLKSDIEIGNKSTFIQISTNEFLIKKAVSSNSFSVDI